ncbi:S-layer homology domain-containing protein [Paenibacillus sp. GCM10012307]|uniref:FIVAR domain-containing protein n=1 Tax=Paenibacillus roseus TaxID=2798579 RepID=A0A934JBY9_9BACL|nr:S-layer homology domain-containing protein [Paenibacillus roseus]MBJ6364003.1 FIVAR domain-containing protein [Paenibacillus roseus]
MIVQRQTDWFKRLALLLVISMTAASLSAVWSPRNASAADGPRLSDLGNVTYVGGHDPVTLAPNVKVSGEGTLSGGLIKFKVDDARSSENLSVKRVQNPDNTAGKISIVGDAVYLGDGTIAKQVGSVNSVNNGQGGKELQIDFSTPLANGDFEQGTDAGWTITKSKVTLGTLATKTQGKPVTISGNGPSYTVSGNVVQNGTSTPYSFSTDVNYSGRPAWANEGVERSLNVNGNNNFNAAVITESGNQVLRLWFSGALVSNSNANNAYGSVFGPDAVSSPFAAEAGDSLAFDWKAENGGDDYEVYGFLYNVDTRQYTELMYGRGLKKDWTTSRGTIPADGNYQFRFVAGSYDRTGGYGLGASLYIDNVRVVGTSVTSMVAQNIARLVNYKNTSVAEAGQRKITVTLHDAEQLKDTGTILVDLVATDALRNRLHAILDAIQDESEYIPSRWTELQKAIEDAQTVLSNANATQEQVDEALGKLNTAKSNLVDKAVLQARKDDLYKLKPDQYDADRWQAMDAALKAAKEVLTDDDVTQTDVDAALARLSEAKAALVDKTALEDRVAELKPLHSEDYTPENFQLLQDAMNEAEAVLEDDEATQVEVNDALSKLNAARQGLVDKEGLLGAKNRIETENLNSDHYTEASWDALQQQLNDTQAMLDNDNATQRAVDAAKASLNAARDALVNKYALKQKTDEINRLQETDYLPANWFVLQKALADAEQVLDNPAASRQEINDALEHLNAARQALVVKDALQAKVVEVRTLEETDYAPEAWQALLEALAEATAVLDDADTTQVAVDAAWGKLETARLALVDKTELQAQYDEIIAENLKGGRYTTKSWAALEQALADAKSLLDKANATPAQVADALSKLEEARQGLVLIPYYPSAPTGPSNDGKQKVAVDVLSGADKADRAVKLDLERTKHEDGRLTDQLTLSPAKIQEAAGKATAQGEKAVRIVVPGGKDEVSELRVDVPSATVDILKSNKFDLEIHSSSGTIRLPSSSMEGVSDAFYIRMTLVNDEKQLNDLEQRVATSEQVKQLAGTDKVKVVSRPVKIDSNLADLPIIVTLPLAGVKLPSGAAERAAFLKELAIYIEHGDGSKELSLVEPEIVTLENGELALKFSTNKLGILSIVHVESEEADSHKAYIHAYPDGQFRPDQIVTRAEMAAMLVRLSGLETAELKGKVFEDVSPAHWASKLAIQASDANLMKGYKDGSFKPGGSITRAEMAAVVYNQLKLSKSDETVGLADVPAGHWASGIIAAVQTTGLMSVFADGTFKPNQELTRAEAIMILNRLFNRGPLYGVPTPSWSDVDISHPAYFDIEEASTDHDFTPRKEGGEQWASRK